uniref:Uncharacterized protein MANES_S061300 n=1 Tax=Rhizophora mucronata TaxID=61149 RepID=A0A2P2L1L5_RHIMU
MALQQAKRWMPRKFMRSLQMGLICIAKPLHTVLFPLSPVAELREKETLAVKRSM